VEALGLPRKRSAISQPARNGRTLAPDTIRPVNEAVDIYLDMTAANRHRLMTGAH
jgi:hypothetical protein